MRYCTLTWSGGVPTLSSVSEVPTPAYAAPLDAPASGSAVPIDVGTDRLLQAVVRGGKLWTTRNVGVNSTGGSAAADRTGCEWIELSLSGDVAALSQSGRVYDPASTDPRFYYYPSLAVNGLGSVVMGFSGSKSSEFAGAFTCGRLAGDPAGAIGAISVVKSGEAEYLRTDGEGHNRWGNYSATTVDPADDLTVWTIQEYARSDGDLWSTWILPLKSPAPTLNTPAPPATAAVDATGVSVPLTGTGLFDPGPGFPNRFQASISGDGISNLVATVNGPDSLTLTFDVSASATLGLRDVTITNPDGQTADAVSAINVSHPTTITVPSAEGGVNHSVDITATLVQSTGSVPLSGQTLRFKLDGSTLGTATTNASGTATYAYTIPDTVASGAHAITVEFDGDASNAAASGAGTLTIDKAVVAFSLYAVIGAHGDTVTLKSLFAGGGKAIVGRSVEFSVDGTPVGTAISDASGVSLSYTIPSDMTYGLHDVTVSFAGDSAYTSGSRTSSVLNCKPKVLFSLYAVTGGQGAAVTLKTLVYGAGVPVSGLAIQFAVDGTSAGSAVSTSSGAARAYTIPSSMTPGKHDV
ncbi:MAG: hypothetical protein NTY02_20585, partial [Acidobacteria bacterium]|nr:hypothetical protein [Acidobacteriota bacterium]